MSGDFDLEGQVALVTGGNSGIGFALAAALAAAGSDVCVWGRDGERNEAARRRLAAHGTRVHALACDVASPDQVARAFDATVAALGRIDSCFACAGVAAPGTRFLDMSPGEFRDVLAVNLDGAFLTLQGAARQMVDQGEGGSLVGVASLAALSGQPRGQHYAASKAGLVAIVKSCAVELARHGIRANSILPGWTETPMAAEVLASPPFVERVLPRVPARRWGTPDDFAGIAVYLAGEASRYHTGDSFLIDGGYSIF